MKKQIIFPLLFAIATGITPLKAGQGYFTSIPADDSAKAKELNIRASWIIILNSSDKDSLNLAVNLCTEAIKLDENNATAFFNRGDANLLMENYTEALKDFDVAVAKEGDGYDYEFRGECKFKLGDKDGALTDFKSAQQKGLATSTGGAHLAMDDANELGIAYYNEKEYSKAVDAFTVSVDAQQNENNLFNRANAEYLNGDKPSALQDWKKSGKLGNKEGKKSYKAFRK